MRHSPGPCCTLHPRLHMLCLTLCLPLVAVFALAQDAPEPGDSGDDAAPESRSPYGPAVIGQDGEVEMWRMPVLAREDTFGVRLRYAMREVAIEGERVTLKEILQRAQAGEERRRQEVKDIQYTENARAVILGSRTGSDRRRIFEERKRIYHKMPDQMLEVSLASRKYGDQDEKESVEVKSQVSINMEDALNFAHAPFYLEDIDAYRYRIVDRRVFPDRVVYAVAFEPRNDFDIEPSGTFWIDAKDFVIIHEEMRFERNPAPLLLKSIDSIVRERRLIDGFLAVTRIQARVELRVSLILGFKAVELEMTYTDFAFNQDLDDAFFQGNAGQQAADSGDD